MLPVAEQLSGISESITSLGLEASNLTPEADTTALPEKSALQLARDLVEAGSTYIDFRNEEYCDILRKHGDVFNRYVPLIETLSRYGTHLDGEALLKLIKRSADSAHDLLPIFEECPLLLGPFALGRWIPALHIHDANEVFNESFAVSRISDESCKQIEARLEYNKRLYKSLLDKLGDKDYIESFSRVLEPDLGEVAHLDLQLLNKGTKYLEGIHIIILPEDAMAPVWSLTLCSDGTVREPFNKGASSYGYLYLERDGIHEGRLVALLADPDLTKDDLEHALSVRVDAATNAVGIMEYVLAS